MSRVIGCSMALLALGAAVMFAQEGAKRKALPAPAAPPPAKSKLAPAKTQPANTPEAAQTTKAAPKAAQPEDAATDPIRQSLREYADAFNKNDAEALAARWSDTGVHVDSQTGERTTGREALLADFQKLFKDKAGARLAAEVSSLRLIKPDVASVEGRASVILPGEEPSATAFTAILVKQDDQWLLDSVNESPLPTPSSAASALKELEWMIGHWMDDSDTDQVDTTVRWGASGSFLVRSFVVQREDEDLQQGTQVIGWDPLQKQIRSWSFFSDGSFGEGLWSKSGDEWLVKSTQTLADGSLASGTQVIARVDDNTVTVKTIGREVDGEPAPSSEPVTVVRAAAAEPIETDAAPNGTPTDTP